MGALVALTLLGLAGCAMVFLASWAALVIRNEVEMRRLRKLGRTILPVFPWGYIDITPRPMPLPPWEPRPTNPEGREI